MASDNPSPVAIKIMESNMTDDKKNEAITLVTSIDELIAILNNLDKQRKKRKKDTRLKGDIRKKAEELTRNFDKLTIILKSFTDELHVLLPKPSYSWSSGDKATTAEGKKISLNREPGSEPNNNNSSLAGWQDLRRGGFNDRPEKWVQMHLINEMLGGKGVPGNLVPGPQSVNSGRKMKNIELKAKQIVGPRGGAEGKEIYKVKLQDVSDSAKAAVIYKKVKVKWWPDSALKSQEYMDKNGQLFSPRGSNYAKRVDYQINEYSGPYCTTYSGRYCTGHSGGCCTTL